MIKNSLKTALKLEKVTKIYPNGTIANSEIDLKLYYGQIHALFGENGSGKTTLIKNILGENKITQGKIIVNDQLLANHSPKQAKDFNMAVVHQHFALIENFSVFENVILGYEKQTKNKIAKIEQIYQKKLQELKVWHQKQSSSDQKDKKYQKKLMQLNHWKKKESEIFFCYQDSLKKEVKDLIDKFDLNLDIEAIIAELSVNKKQKTEILKVLFKAAKIIIFDEPTSVISTSEIDKFLNSLLAFKKSGKAVIFISHKVEEIRKIADWVTVLWKGKVVGSFSINDVTDEQLIQLMVGSQKLSNLDEITKKPVQSENVLKIVNLSLKSNQKQVLNKINLSVKKGEIVGIAGLEENGQKELLEAIARINTGCQGQILYQKKVKLLNLSPMKTKSLGIAYVPQDRQLQGLILDQTLYFNTFFADWNNSQFFKFGIIQKNNILQHTEKIINKYRVDGIKSLQQAAATLSGGNQQKFIIGRELETNPNLLLIHEPTWGIDVGTINYLSKLLIQFRNQGKSVLFASSELNDVLSLSDRILIISKGHIMGVVDPKKKNALQAIGKLMVKKVNLDGNKI